MGVYTFISASRYPAAAAGDANNPIPAVYSASGGTNCLVILSIPNEGSNTLRTGGAPTYGGTAMSPVMSGSATEVAADMWYIINPPAGLQNISVPNAGTQEQFLIFVTAQCGAGSSSIFLSQSMRIATEANPTVTINASGMSSGQGAVWYMAGLDSGLQSIGSTGTDRIVFVQDAGSQGWAVQVTSASIATTKTISWTNATSDDYVYIIGAFGEQWNAPPVPVVPAWSMIFNDDDILFT